MRVAPVRTVDDHKRAMARIAQIFDAGEGTTDADELEVLTTLVARYEQASTPSPSPVEAIKFRMRQARLSNRDLEPFLGSRARVSEVLNGSRGLTIDMMRALNSHLGIPAQALLGSRTNLSVEPEPSARAMAELVATGLMRANEKFGAFVERALESNARGKGWAPARLRNTRTERTNAKTDAAALQGWCAAVLLKAAVVPKSNAVRRLKYGEKMARQIAQLSSSPDGIKAVEAFLAARGITLVILKHLSGTFLDGAAMRRADGQRIIALTVRYDRIDNFWFTLLHEFAHVACHLDAETDIILDDLEIGSSEAIEAEADAFAQRALIPDVIWQPAATPDMSIDDVIRVAADAGVHPAIVAGRWQREYRDYRRFARLVGHGEVRRVIA